MARQIEVQGKITGIPGMYSNGVELAGPANPGILETGLAVLIGSCDGGIKPKTPILFRTPRNLKSLLEGGRLFDGSRFCFEPSREDRRKVKGASAVMVVRVDPATQGTATLANGSAATLLTLATAFYGLGANGFTRKLEAGTSGAYGRKITIGKPGADDEVGDDLGFLPAAIISYGGDASTAAMTITSSSLATALAGDQTDGSADLSCSFSTYNTLQKLADYINAQTGYSMVIVANNPTTFNPADLDYVSAVDIKEEAAASISFANETTDTFTGTYTNLDDGDVFQIGSEYVYVISASSKTAIRGYLDSEPATHSGVAAGSYYPLTATTKAILDWCNNTSQRVTATRHASNTGYPAAASVAYFSGATEPAAGTDDWQDAYNAIRDYAAPFVVPLNWSSAIRAIHKTHMANRWGANANEGLAHVGIADDQTKSQIRTECKALQDPNTSLWFQGIVRNNADGVRTEYGPWAMAASATGIQAGMPVGTPLTHKSLDVIEVTQNSTIDLVDDGEDFVLTGASFAAYDGDDYRIVRCLSTWTNNDDFYLISPNVRCAIANTEKLVRSYIRTRHFAERGAEGDVASIKATILNALGEARRRGWIVAGSRYIGGQKTTIPAFDPQAISVDRTGNVIDYELAYTPVDGNDFFRSASKVKEWQAVA